MTVIHSKISTNSQAIRENAIALTADRIWADLDLPCKVELIR